MKTKLSLAKAKSFLSPDRVVISYSKEILAREIPPYELSTYGISIDEIIRDEISTNECAPFFAYTDLSYSATRSTIRIHTSYTSSIFVRKLLSQ
ncbi:Hypothetical predicted protein [Octopus vulgaris]|uniref:Uncharacterized protein n=1 Tax=Octopus vulgaris TaxID=6645 RepID=A0AA36ANS3_OCTVU|nr:Hypothetical predicted protein [Octopus vulgaris]